MAKVKFVDTGRVVTVCRIKLVEFDEDMEGSCFTISSLGNLGGSGFTPIVNAPEVAILGVSKASIKPVWQKDKFVPRTILPFSLSYDHRAVNGVDGGMFCTYLGTILSDIRLML